MSDLITKKIDELIALAEMEGEPNVQIILLTLNASRLLEWDGNLAGTVQEFSKQAIGKITTIKDQEKISRN